MKKLISLDENRIAFIAFHETGSFPKETLEIWRELKQTPPLDLSDIEKAQLKAVEETTGIWMPEVTLIGIVNVDPKAEPSHVTGITRQHLDLINKGIEELYEEFISASVPCGTLAEHKYG